MYNYHRNIRLLMFNNNKPTHFSNNNNKPPVCIDYVTPIITIQTKCNEIMNAAIESETILVMNLLEKYDIEPSNQYLTDKSQQNLLHIAVKTKNYMLTEFLIEKNVVQDKNIFGETPLNIAMKNSDSRMIELLYEVNKINNYKQLNTKLEVKYDDLQFSYNRISYVNDQLRTENNNLKITNKRLRDNEDANDREIKKLRIDKSSLMEDNRILQTTINNLRNSMKK